ncbi:MAG: F0F1 ATP synthase subunit epsilon [Legionellales bacterium]|jgi:F-type H+-transporting ATPase subunit epsilon|nr:F0F1 ATP synthase subunit epsilon [Legionellales bacterium]
MSNMHLDIVSAEKSLFSGEVVAVHATLMMGEVGIFPGHAPLLSPLKPGTIKVTFDSGKQQSFYISGGLLEVQPTIITVLADTAIRAENLDEAAALEAQKNAREKLSSCQSQMDYSAALSELAAAAAQIRIIKERKKF